MSNLSIPNSFVSGTKAKAAEVNGNFTAIQSYINLLNAGTNFWDNVKSTAAISVKATTSQFVLGDPASTTITLTAPAPVSSAVYTIPDVGTTGSFVMTTGTQTISGSKTFSSAVAMGSNKITGLANGTSTTDAATVSNVNNAFVNNALINGNFTFWQRTGATGSTTGSDGSYCADRWRITTVTNPTTANVAYDNTAADLDVAGASSAKVTMTTVGSCTRFYLQQRVENYQDYAGKTITLTVRIKTNSGTTTAVKCQIDDGIATSQSSAATGSSSFETLTVTQAVSTSASRLYINIGWVDASPAAAVFVVASAMCVLGSVSVPFVARPYAQELALCQRYYEKAALPDTAPTTGATFFYANASQTNTTTMDAFISFKAMKRTAGSAITLYDNTGTSGKLVWTTTGGTDNNRTSSAVVVTANGFLARQTVATDQRCSGSWTADCEL